jgi:uncharacterized protein (DUF2141 family)
MVDRGSSLGKTNAFFDVVCDEWQENGVKRRSLLELRSRRKSASRRTDADMRRRGKHNLSIAPTGLFANWRNRMKKYLVAVIAAALVALVTWDAKAQSTSVCPTLNVTGLKAGEGVLMIAVYAKSEEFFKKPAWMTAQKVSNTSMQVPVCNLEVDEIAVTAFQDMNGNQKLDMNPIGIPTEPYAASGTPAMFGAPTWNDTKVTYKNTSATIAIKF